MVEQNGGRYSTLLERLFLAHFRPGAVEIEFDRDELVSTASSLGIRLPKNLGDVIYSFRYRRPLPQAIRERAPEGKIWIIRPAGIGRYRFVAVTPHAIVPNPALAETKVPDATPGIISKHALSDEQSLLAKVRYSRLIDVFTGVTCYSLQSHLRTTAPGLGQVETDEVYIGVDKRGAQYVFPVQAKGGGDTQNVVQIEQDLAMCADKFPDLICRPIAAQFMTPDLIALFDFEASEDGPRVVSERHYRLVPHKEITSDDFEQYRNRSE